MPNCHAEKSHTVFVAGLGGLGSPVTMYLAAAGIDRIILCDGDHVEPQNLNRQLIYTMADVGASKTFAAQKRVQAINPRVTAMAINGYLTAENAQRLIGKPDIVLDCLDSLDGKYLLNSYCMRENIPLVHGAVSGWCGQLTVVEPHRSPCLRCWFSYSADNYEKLPVIGPIAGIIGCMMAAETGSTLYMTKTR